MPSFLSRLFGAGATARAAKDEKHSRAAAMLALHSIGLPQWTPRNYATLTREGFERNAVCHRSVRMIAEACASVPWLMYEGRNEITEHPALDLVARPNPCDTSVSFIEAICANLLLFGNAYVEAAFVDGELREMYALRPDRMSVLPGRNGWPQAYVYTAMGDSVRYEMQGEGVEPILHVKLFNPLDDHYGFSPLAAAAVALDTHNAASFWNKALLDNSARPSGALVYGGGAHLSDEQFTRLKEELEESFSGAGNAGRPLLLEGGLDWKALSLTPKDMDFAETKSSAAREIALAFGVPPLLLGLPGDNTFRNYQEANRAFWRQTVIPLVVRLQKSFQAWLRPAFGPFRFDYNADRIDALAEERAVEWKRVGDAAFLTVDEQREAVGYGPMPKGAKWSSVAPEARYSPDQPRVPAGGPGGGQWTSGGGASGGRFALTVDPNVASDAGNGILPAQASGPIDLRDEEGGPFRAHTIGEHVGKSEESLKRRLENSRIRFGPYEFWLDRAGSFSSLEAANKLVNSTLAQNSATAERVASGDIGVFKSVQIESWFASPTGYEAYRSSPRAQPKIRATNGVRVVLRHNPFSSKRYTIVSAYPIGR